MMVERHRHHLKYQIGQEEKRKLTNKKEHDPRD